MILRKFLIISQSIFAVPCVSLQFIFSLIRIIQINFIFLGFLNGVPFHIKFPFRVNHPDLHLPDFSDSQRFPCKTGFFCKFTGNRILRCLDCQSCSIAKRVFTDCCNIVRYYNLFQIRNIHKCFFTDLSYCSSFHCSVHGICAEISILCSGYLIGICLRNIFIDDVILYNPGCRNRICLCTVLRLHFCHGCFIFP